jgi:phospholipase C
MKRITVLIILLGLLIASCATTPVITQSGSAVTETKTLLPESKMTAKSSATLVHSTSVAETSTSQVTPTIEPSVRTPTETLANLTETTTPAASSTVTPAPRLVPDFDHIVMIILENKDYGEVIGSKQAPNLNAMANEYVLLSEYYAVTHPSLPNYIALVSGSTQGITTDCNTCFVNAPNLADLIEANDRTWKGYMEDLPSPCYIGSDFPYAQRHDPYIYFDSIRLNKMRCEAGVVPLTQLDNDLSSNNLPNFSMIIPNVCNDAHDCPLRTADKWVKDMLDKLQSSPALGENSLIVIVFDEASRDNYGSCCDLGKRAGGRVAAVLISPLAESAFIDSTAYSHYSMLKTILTAWSLPDLANTAQAQPITGFWK